MNAFGAIFGLQLNRKKTKTIWIGATSKNKTKILEFKRPMKDPVKFLGTYLSHDETENNKYNFLLKIKKMETTLDIWLSRSLTLFERTLLAKA